MWVDYALGIRSPGASIDVQETLEYHSSYAYLVARTRSYLANGSKDGADPSGPVQICYMKSHDPGVTNRQKLGVSEGNARYPMMQAAS